MGNFVLLLILTLFSQAQTTGRLLCTYGTDEPVYELSRRTDGDFNLRVVYPRGSASGPLFSGDVSASMFPYLQTKWDFVDQLGDRFEVVIPKSQCIRKHKGDLLYVHCYIKESLVLNGVTLPAGFSFHADSKKVAVLGVDEAESVEYVEYSVGLEMSTYNARGIQWLDFARTYGGEDCVADEAFWLP